MSANGYTTKSLVTKMNFYYVIIPINQPYLFRYISSILFVAAVWSLSTFIHLFIYDPFTTTSTTTIPEAPASEFLEIPTNVS